MGKFTKKLSAGQARSSGGGELDDGDFRAKFPALYEYMTETDSGGKHPRVTLTLLLTVDAGCLKAWVNDRDNQRAAWVTAESLDKLLRVVDAGLAEDSLEWRSQASQGRKK